MARDHRSRNSLVLLHRNRQSRLCPAEFFVAVAEKCTSHVFLRCAGAHLTQAQSTRRSPKIVKAAGNCTSWKIRSASGSMSFESASNTRRYRSAPKWLCAECVASGEVAFRYPGIFTCIPVLT